MEPSSWCIYCTKNRQKLTGDEKVIVPKSKGIRFYKKVLTEQLIAYFQSPPKKSLNITLLPLELEDRL
jgi:hypothetical protein